MRTDVIELVFVSGTQMCLNAQHAMLPTFGWNWHCLVNGDGLIDNAIVEQGGWQLDYVGRHPTNIYVFLFALNSGVNEMYSDLPFRYWDNVVKMTSARRLSELANKESRFIDEIAYEMVMFLGALAMEQQLEEM